MFKNTHGQTCVLQKLVSLLSEPSCAFGLQNALGQRTLIIIYMNIYPLPFIFNLKSGNIIFSYFCVVFIAKQSFLLPFPSLLKKLRQLHSPPPPLIFQNEVLYTSQNNAAEARRYSMCNNKNTPLSVFCQATWLQRQQLKGERASSCCQCWAGWWGCSVAGDGEGLAMLHRAVLSPLVSDAEEQGPGEMPTGSIPEASSPRL